MMVETSLCSDGWVATNLVLLTLHASASFQRYLHRIVGGWLAPVSLDE